MKNFFGQFTTSNPIEEQLIDIQSLKVVNGIFAANYEVLHTSEDEHQLFFLGRIYNLDELSKKYGLPEASQVETILNLYIKKGNACFEYLEGEFCIIIYNENEVLIARDRHGAGPQIYYTSSGYASHLIGLKNFKNFSPQPDESALATFLSLGYVPAPQTSLRGVSKIPAGHILHVENGNSRLHPLYNWEKFIAPSGTSKLSFDDAVHEFDNLLKSAIKQRTEGKNHVGILLSGGYDSGGNIAALRDMYQGDIHAISIGFKNNPWTEVPLAKIMADVFGAKFTDYEIDGSEIMEFPSVMDQLGDPFQEGGLMVNFMAMKMAAEIAPEIILGGDGNDQMFGTSGKELAMNHKIRSMHMNWGQRLFSKAGENAIFDNTDMLFRLRFHNEKILNILESDCFGFRNYQIKKLLKSGAQLPTADYTRKIPRKVDSFDQFYLVRNYFIDIDQVINEVILFKASRMAEQFGNNITFPYTDGKIYNFLQTLPRQFKCKGSPEEINKGQGIAKHLHKACFKPRLPKEITERKKQGGFAPLPLFFEDKEQFRIVSELILKSGAAEHLFNKEYINQFLTSYASHENANAWFWHKQLNAFKLFNLMIVCVWWERMFNNKQDTNLNAYL
ncbi:MAG: asparagine synthase-related protein [Bacteroidales bacterium]|nr:asparagine synthase-related protein [Bacteroidales bacterium]